MSISLRIYTQRKPLVHGSTVHSNDGTGFFLVFFPLLFLERVGTALAEVQEASEKGRGVWVSVLPLRSQSLRGPGGAWVLPSSVNDSHSL